MKYFVFFSPLGNVISPLKRPAPSRPGGSLCIRNGKAFTNFGHIEQQLIPHIKRISMKMFNTGTDFVLDDGQTL